LLLASTTSASDYDDYSGREQEPFDDSDDCFRKSRFLFSSKDESQKFLFFFPVFYPLCTVCFSSLFKLDLVFLARSGCRDRSGWLELGALRAPARSGCLVLAAVGAPGRDFGSQNGSIFVYFRCLHACDGSCMRGRQNTAKTDTKRISVLSHDQQKVSENRFDF